MAHRAVVTGAAGFIGSQLSERLISIGYEVVGIDDFDDYYSRRSKQRNLRALRGDRRFRFLERDIVTSDVRRLLKPGTRVFHMAAQPGVRPSWGVYFQRYVRNNILATQKILEASRRSPIESFVYASSSSIYGAQPFRPVSEDTLPQPISPYGVTKLSGEHLSRVYRSGFRVPAVSLRFFTVFGSRQRPDMAFHRFFEALRANRPISVYGDGRQVRDFTHVSDILDGLVAASSPGVPGEVYNLGGGSPSTLSDAIRAMADVSGREPVVEKSPASVGDPNSTWADTHRAQKDLGFRPKVSLREGLAEQWAWQSALRSSPS